MESITFYYGRKKPSFFLIFITELFFAALSYLTAQSSLYLTLIFFIFLNINTYQISKEHYLNEKPATYFGISRAKRFWK